MTSRVKSQKLENTASDQDKDNTSPTAPTALLHKTVDECKEENNKGTH